MNKLKALSVLAITAAMVSSCSEEQTSFNIDNVPGKATIQGTVVYNEGTSVENGRFVYDYRPAANLPVIVIVDNNDYSDNLTGETVFETVTDENGKYTIEIPAPLHNGIASVRTAEFQGVHNTVIRKNNQLITEETNVVYGVEKNVSIHCQGIVYCDMVCTERSAEDIPTGYVEYAALCGKVGQNYQLLQPTQPIDCFTWAANADALMTISYEDGSQFTYNVTTDATGNFTLQVPVKEFPATFHYSIEVLPYEGIFTTYAYSNDLADYVSHTLKGYYTQYTGAAGTDGYVSYPVATATKSFEVQAMIFEAAEGEETYGYYPGNYMQTLPWLGELLNPAE